MVSVMLPVAVVNTTPSNPNEDVTSKIGPIFEGLSRDHYHMMLKYYLDCGTYQGNNWKWIVRNRVVHTHTSDELFPQVSEWLDVWEKCVVRVESEEMISFGVEYSAQTDIFDSKQGYRIVIEDTAGTVYDAIFDEYEMDQLIDIISNTAIYTEAGEGIRP